MRDLERFADLLIFYGQKRDFIEAENCGHYLKSIFLSEDKFVKQDIKEVTGGLIDYKENGTN